MSKKKSIASSLAKLYNCSSNDFGVKFEDRKREDITRSRTVPDPKTEEKARDVIDFIKGSGLRRHEILKLKKEDVAERMTENLPYTFVKEKKQKRLYFRNLKHTLK